MKLTDDFEIAAESTEEIFIPHCGWLAHAPGDDVAHYLNEGWFEHAEMAFCWLYLRNGDTLFDCGAHIGMFSILASKLIGRSGQIVSFEPNPETATLLESNLSSHGVSIAEVLQLGIFDEARQISFHIAGRGRSAYSSIIEPVDASTELTIDTITLDQIVTERGLEKINFLKLDVEGAEIEALKGARESIGSGQISLLMIEFTEANLQASDRSTKDLWNSIEDLGLKLYRFDTENLKLEPASLDGPIYYENLFATKLPIGQINRRLRGANKERRRIARDLIQHGKAAGALRDLKPIARNLQTKVDAQERGLDKLRLERNNLREKVEFFGTAAAKIQESLKNQLLESQGQLTELQGQLTEARGQLAEARGQLTEARGQLTEARGQLTEARGQLAERSAKIAKLQVVAEERFTLLEDSREHLERVNSRFHQIIDTSRLLRTAVRLKLIRWNHLVEPRKWLNKVISNIDAHMTASDAGPSGVARTDTPFGSAQQPAPSSEAEPTPAEPKDKTQQASPNMNAMQKDPTSTASACGVQKSLITVITVVYNDEKHIARTVRSVTGQKNANFEYIVIDGASIDDTLKILNDHAPRIDKLISEPDKGIYDAMIKGANLAQGKWVIFMNSGDVFANDRVISKFCPDPDTDLAYGEAVWEDGHNSPWPTRSIDWLWQGVVFSHQSLFCRTEIVRKYGFNTNLRIVSDYDFYVRCFMDGLKFQNMNYLIARFLPGGISHVQKYRRTWERFPIAYKAFPDQPVVRHFAKIVLGFLKKDLHLFSRNWYRRLSRLGK